MKRTVVVWLSYRYWKSTDYNYRISLSTRPPPPTKNMHAPTHHRLTISNPIYTCTNTLTAIAWSAHLLIQAAAINSPPPPPQPLALRRLIHSARDLAQADYLDAGRGAVTAAAATVVRRRQLRPTRRRRLRRHWRPPQQQMSRA